MHKPFWLGSLLLCLATPPAGAGEWLDKEWGWRNQLVLENSTDTALSDQQVRLEIPCLDGMRRKFQDLRFATADGKLELGYWLEQVVPEEKAVVWVRIPELPAGGPQAPARRVLYVYYGNKTTESKSSFDAVFDKLQPIPGTVGLWHFDEGQGKEIEDFSGKGHRAIIVGDSISWEMHDGGQWGSQPEVRFAQGGCLRFGGDGTRTGDCVQVDPAADLNVTSFTIECWVKLAGVPGELVRKGSNAWLGVYSDLRPYSWFVGGPPTSLIPGERWPILKLNEWYHLASTFDAATHDYRIYVNGICQAQTRTEGVPEPNPNLLAMGGYYGPTLNGWLDEVRIVARALSEQELKASLERRKFTPVEPRVTLDDQVEAAPPG